MNVSQFPKGSTLNLLDRNYTRLYRHPDNEKYAGKVDLPETAKQISTGQGEGFSHPSELMGSSVFTLISSFS